MNQLQSLLHDSLIATGHVQQCAIIRRKDTSLRSSTVGFSFYFSKDEIDHLKWKCEVYCHDITSSAKWISTKKSALYLESDFVPGYNEPIREQPSLDNIHALVHSFTNSSQARREGLKFQEIVYECVRADRFSVYAKHENSGIILVRTATLLLVATYTPEMSPSICVEAVEKLADYFREKGK